MKEIESRNLHRLRRYLRTAKAAITDLEEVVAESLLTDEPIDWSGIALLGARASEYAAFIRETGANVARELKE